MKSGLLQRPYQGKATCKIQGTYAHDFVAHHPACLHDGFSGNGFFLPFFRMEVFVEQHVSAAEDQRRPLGVLGQVVNRDCFFGQTAQTVVASATAIKLTHIVIVVDETEGGRLRQRSGEQHQQKGQKEKTIFSWIHVVVHVV